MRLQANLRTGVHGAGRQPLVGPAYVENAAARNPVTLGHVRGGADHPDRVHRVPARRREPKPAQRPDEAATTRAHRLADGVTAFEHHHAEPAPSRFGRRSETRGTAADDDDVNALHAVLTDDGGRVRHQATIQNRQRGRMWLMRPLARTVAAASAVVLTAALAATAGTT